MVCRGPHAFATVEPGQHCDTQESYAFHRQKHHNCKPSKPLVGPVYMVSTSQTASSNRQAMTTQSELQKALHAPPRQYLLRASPLRGASSETSFWKHSTLTRVSSHNVEVVRGLNCKIQRPLAHRPALEKHSLLAILPSHDAGQSCLYCAHGQATRIVCTQFYAILMQVLSRSVLIPNVRLPRSVCCRQRHATTAHAAAPANTRVRYIKRPQESNLFMYSVPPPKEVDSVANISVDEVPMRLSDLRTAKPMTLQQNGFELVQIPSGQGINWDDREQVCSRL